MSELQIITNNQPRDLLYRDQVPDKVLQDQFDYLDDETDGFFKYKNHYYHIADFMTIDNNAPDEIKDYHGYSNDSFFSGVLIKLCNDNESVIAATYLS